MRHGLYFENIWLDDDMFELKIVVKDGDLQFVNQVYVGYDQIEELRKGMSIFKLEIHGGIFNMEIGAFGPEYASGAFSARLHFQERGKIYISVKMQSEFYDFGKKKIANEASMYLISEPALLDNFINDLGSIDKGIGNNATLECIGK